MKEDQIIMDEVVMGDEEYRQAMVDYLFLLASPDAKLNDIEELKRKIDQYEKFHKES